MTEALSSEAPGVTRSFCEHTKEPVAITAGGDPTMEIDATLVSVCLPATTSWLSTDLDREVVLAARPATARV